MLNQTAIWNNEDSKTVSSGAELIVVINKLLYNEVKY